MALPTPESEVTEPLDLTAAAEELDQLAAQLAQLDDRRDDVITRQHELIRAMHAQFPDLSYRQLGTLARMSHQNVALIFGWTSPATRPKKRAKPAAR